MPDDAATSPSILTDLAGHLAPALQPMIVNDILPAIQRDTALQDRVGAAIGKAVADELRSRVNIAVGALVVLAVAAIVLAVTMAFEAFSGSD